MKNLKRETEKEMEVRLSKRNSDEINSSLKKAEVEVEKRQRERQEEEKEIMINQGTWRKPLSA